MTNSAVTIHCVNQKCNALNPLDAQFCCECATPVVKRYLWSFSKQPQQVNKLGELIGDRYILKKDNIFIDIKPGIAPPLPEEVPPEISTYLKLFPYRLYLPQIYGYIKQKEPIWLLEYSSISLDEKGELIFPKFCPSLEEVWQNTSPLRQLNWLSQIMQLWQPLATQKVVSSLLNQELLRVNGSLISILELQDDSQSNPTLKNLGELWLNWSKNCGESIAEIVEKIGFCLQQGLITDPEKVLAILDQTISELTEDQFLRKYQVITLTDSGGKRGNNEDSCYPAPETFKETDSGIDTLAIVCDGLGGQEGGEIASNLAIKTLQRELSFLFKEKIQDTENKVEKKLISDSDKIINAISKANNKITRRNNTEKRKERARMGTTIVMSLALEHEIYIANVGDSRVYLITRRNCHQLTIDDDLASREVRLGYGFYRDMIKSPQMGALLQALGMEDSEHLNVHLQRFMLDQDCIFLLCSDGFSDFDRVEQYWQSQIVPILNKKIDLLQAAKNLLNIGIEKNGHDNITIGLVYCQVEAKDDQPEKILFWEDIQKHIPNLPDVLDSSTGLKKSGKVDLKSPVILYSIIALVLVIFGILITPTIKQIFNPQTNESNQ